MILVALTCKWLSTLSLPVRSSRRIWYVLKFAFSFCWFGPFFSHSFYLFLTSHVFFMMFPLSRDRGTLAERDYTGVLL